MLCSYWSTAGCCSLFILNHFWLQLFMLNHCGLFASAYWITVHCCPLLILKHCCLQLKPLPKSTADTPVWVRKSYVCSEVREDRSVMHNWLHVNNLHFWHHKIRPGSFWFNFTENNSVAIYKPWRAEEPHSRFPFYKVQGQVLLQGI